MRASPWPLSLTLIYVTLLAAITFQNWIGADRTWLGAVNLYLPQVMWALPGVALALWMLKANRRLVWLPILSVLWCVGPIMGCSWSLTTGAGASGQLKLRVMTWNIKYGRYDLKPLVKEIDRYRPDLVFFQDAPRAMEGPLALYFRNWQVRSFGQYLIASRYPLSQAEPLDLPSYFHREENLLRCRMQLGPTPVTLYNVHFNTPRNGLNQFRTAKDRPWYLPRAISTFNDDVTIRFLQATSVYDYLAGEQGAVIVAGDLNAPDNSRVCGTLRSAGLHDAFSEGGRGYGFTYGHKLLKYRLPWLRMSWIRIDHIMVSRGFVTRNCWAGTGEASDHRPVIADLAL